jgi:hypothetical protein
MNINNKVMDESGLYFGVRRETGNRITQYFYPNSAQVITADKIKTSATDATNV